MLPVCLLCDLIGLARPVPVAACRTSAAYGTLLSAGLVRQTGLVQSALCDACDLGHDAAIVFENGRYGHLCPEAGFVPVHQADLIAVSPDFDALAKQIAVAFGCGRRPRRISEVSWNLGIVRTGTADIAVFFHPCLQTAQDLHAFEAALRTQVRSRFGLVLTAFGDLAPPNFTAATLDRVLSWDVEQTKLVVDCDLPTLVGAPVVRAGGRPSIHASKIQAIIADRAAGARREIGQNAEIRAILAEFAAKFPEAPAPSHSTVARYLRPGAGGS